jgi:hypothetical protein
LDRVDCDKKENKGFLKKNIAKSRMVKLLLLHQLVDVCVQREVKVRRHYKLRLHYFVVSGRDADIHSFLIGY